MFNIQLKPEYVYAANPDFETFPLSASNEIRQSHILYLNYTDNPERLGDKAYSKLFWGQSRVAIDYKKMSLGVSTENLWWGPGQYNSLTMSNNAPGFLHFTLNTKKPIQTSIGSFEGQLISGKLESSNLDVPEEQYIIDGVNYKQIKSSDWRYINAFSVNYQPKWVPGLFLGLNRVFQIYHENLGHTLSDYLPIIMPFQKGNLSSNEDEIGRDQLASLFFRWVFKESKFEIYAEKGWNDHAANLWDLFESPEHSQANLFGLSKIFTLNSDKTKYLKFNFENTQMQQSADRMVRNSRSWYMHNPIFHGYTNQSQVMGAGIGPSGNSQTFDCSLWNKGNVWGVQLERFAHNMDFYYDAFTIYNQKWVDLNLNTYAYHRFGNLGVQAKLNGTLARHFQWYYSNTFNFQLQLGLQYFLN
ncbi:MAG: capsule assembly Wzi family protein [Flavobacterium sp.]